MKYLSLLIIVFSAAITIIAYIIWISRNSAAIIAIIAAAFTYVFNAIFVWNSKSTIPPFPRYTVYSL